MAISKALVLVPALAGVAGISVWLAQRASGTASLEVSPGPHRPLEARLSHPAADRHRPFRPARATGPARERTLSYRALAALEARRDERGIAAAYLLSGNLRQAQAHLARAKESADTHSDLAAVSLAERRWTQALEDVDRALAKDARHPQASWNRGLALRALGLDLGAAEVFAAVAALQEPGWSAEAAATAAELRQRDQRRRRAWEETQRGRRGFVTGAAPLSPSFVASRPDLARAFFYDALRAAGSPAAVAALAETAGALDVRWDGGVLRAALDRARQSDFARRAPLAAAYAALVAGARPLTPAEARALVDRLRAAGADDILFGALVETRLGFQHGDELVRIARATADPYLELVADDMKAAAELQIEKRPAAAEKRLTEAIGRCDDAGFAHLCTRLRLTLSWLLSRAHRSTEAHAYASDALAVARQRGDDDHVALALTRLTGGALLVRDRAETRAYLEEQLLREPDSCTVRTAAAESLAAIALEELDFAEASRQIARAVGCPSRTLLRTGILATLVRRGGLPEQAMRLTEALRVVRSSPGGLPPGAAALAAAHEGEALLARDPVAGKDLLRKVIEASDRTKVEDGFAARRRSHLALAFDAARRNALTESLALIAAESRFAAPSSCVLAVAADLDQAVAVGRGPDGRLEGAYQTVTALPYNLATIVPPRMIAALAGCAWVAVVAPPPLYGQPRLLPVQYAWSYVSGNRRAPAERPAAVRRVVFSDVTPPAALGLGPLGPWNPSRRPDEEIEHLRGTEVTRNRVLTSMREADQIEFHLHGMVDTSVSDVSFLILSPDPDGVYALTDNDIRRERLVRSPVVVLAACHAGKKTRAHHWSWGLPRAFTEAGARAVLATPTPIPDQEGGAFFEAVATRIARGAVPAVALRDERTAVHSRGRSEQWVDEVMIFE